MSLKESAVPWMRFRVGDRNFAILLAAVTEVAPAGRPDFIPLVPLEIGGVLNVRGEPLPVVQGGVLLGRSPSDGARHALVLEDGSLRVGVLVDQVSRIERGLGEAGTDDALGDEDPEPGPDFVSWVRHGGVRVGLVAAEDLLRQATELLARGAEHRGEETCLSAF
jgi:hypothetical protein